MRYPNQLSVIKYQDPATRTYLGSPSILRLDDSSLLVTYDYFGPGCPRNHEGEEHLTSVYRSSDNGESWTNVTHIAACRPACSSTKAPMLSHRHVGAIRLQSSSAAATMAAIPGTHPRRRAHRPHRPRRTSIMTRPTPLPRRCRCCCRGSPSTGPSRIWIRASWRRGSARWSFPRRRMRSARCRKLERSAIGLLDAALNTAGMGR